MARKTVFVSDLSGDEIRDGEGATITIKFHDARKGQIALDRTKRLLSWGGRPEGGPSRAQAEGGNELDR